MSKAWLKRFIRPFRSVEIHYYDGKVIEDGKERKMTAKEQAYFRNYMNELQEDMNRMAEKMKDLWPK